MRIVRMAASAYQQAKLQPGARSQRLVDDPLEFLSDFDIVAPLAGSFRIIIAVTFAGSAVGESLRHQRWLQVTEVDYHKLVGLIIEGQSQIHVPTSTTGNSHALTILMEVNINM